MGQAEGQGQGAARALAIEAVPLTGGCLGDLERLFEAPGGPRHCWCRVWRAPLAGMTAGPAADRRAIRKAGLAAEVGRGIHAGLIARAQGVPVGWCSCGPRESFPRLGTPPGPAAGALWSVVCLYVPAPLRRRGIAQALLGAAVAAAAASGARAIEATPVLPDSPVFRFTGFVAMFAAAGFAERGPVGRRRRHMWRRLAPAPAAEATCG